jgi:hypothetical protein
MTVVSAFAATTHAAVTIIALMVTTQARSKGPESPLAPWIAQLPYDTPTPLGWSDGDLEELRYPPLVEAVQRQKEEVSAAGPWSLK